MKKHIMSLKERVSVEELLLKAFKVAIRAHKGQFRKDGKEFISHPFVVAAYVYSYGNGDLEMTAAAVLHDTIEDTTITYKYIKESFNDRIANLVQELTIDEKELEKTTKKLYLTKVINKMSEDAFLIKLCDRYNNVSDLQGTNNIKFIKWYYKETNYIISNLDRYINIIQNKLIIKILNKLKELKVIYDLE